MDYPTPLQPATLRQRYKRFLADVVLADGRELTVHSPNTGSMQGCAEPGMRVWVRDTGSSTRKYPWAWELSETEAGVFINVNTLLSNRLVREAIENGVVTELQGYQQLRAEVAYGRQGSRIDLLLEQGEARCYVEVKNVTARAGEVAIFPDAVTARGARHLEELMEVVAAGQRAVLLFCVSRADVSAVAPADAIDPHYGRLLRRAQAQGVEVLAYGVAASPTAIRLQHPLPVVCP